MTLADARLAIVDLETTGGQPGWDRVTEIGVVEVDGFEVSSEWSTLVNPGAAIPAPIQALTGITNEMVAAAPTFGEIAGELYERLSGRVFVAHNARFDYGFLRREFERAGLRFTAKTLCTVRLSRRLYAEHAAHSLDSLIARHGIACRARHRALGDADAVWQFLRIAAREHGEEILSVAARQVAKQPALPPHLDPAAVDAIPEAPGVYIFYGEAGKPLYVGMSRSMRSRVLQHFSTRLAWAPEVRRIDWQRTAGELGALLREAKLVKALAPAYNRQLRRPEALRALADEHRLCLQTLGFELARPGPCFRHQIARCAGVCAGKESIHVHHGCVAEALARLKTMPWPHGGPVGIVERDRDRDAAEVHVVDRWCYLGGASSDSELAELLEAAREPRFDYDQYRILARHLGKKNVRTVRLSPCTAN